MKERKTSEPVSTTRVCAPKDDDLFIDFYSFLLTLTHQLSAIILPVVHCVQIPTIIDYCPHLPLLNEKFEKISNSNDALAH